MGDVWGPDGRTVIITELVQKKKKKKKKIQWPQPPYSQQAATN